jgi:hypothetical protein
MTKSFPFWSDLKFVSVFLGLLPSSAYSWYGPVCYPSDVTSMTLTLQSILGETPGDIKVSFDDNAGVVSLESVKPSQKVRGAHEVSLKRTADSANGVTAVIVTSPKSSVSYKFEMEFRKNASECSGAIIQVSSTNKAEKPKAKKPPAPPLRPKVGKTEEAVSEAASAVSSGKVAAPVVGPAVDPAISQDPVPAEQESEESEVSDSNSEDSNESVLEEAEE